MVKFHKELVKVASHFYGQVKYDGTLNIVTQELQEVLEGIQNTARFRQLMHLEQVSVDEKMSILSKAVSSLSQSTQDYLRPYLHPDKSSYLIEAVEAFLDIYSANRLEMISAIPLTEEQIERIAQAFQKKTKKEYDSYVNTVDPTVIGGVKLKTKEYLLDGTLLYKLEQFKKKICQTGLKG